jgi:hypothetical protein
MLLLETEKIFYYFSERYEQFKLLNKGHRLILPKLQCNFTPRNALFHAKSLLFENQLLVQSVFTHPFGRLYFISYYMHVVVYSTSLSRRIEIFGVVKRSVKERFNFLTINFSKCVNNDDSGFRWTNSNYEYSVAERSIIFAN